VSDNYLERLENELHTAGLDSSTKRRILSEIGEHIRDTQAIDNSPFNADERLGTPKDLADAFGLASWLGARKRVERAERRLFLVLLLWLAGGQSSLAFADRWPLHPAGWGIAQIALWVGLVLATVFHTCGADPFGRTPRQQRLVVWTSWASVYGGALVAGGLCLWTVEHVNHLPAWWVAGSALGAVLTTVTGLRVLAEMGGLSRNRRLSAEGVSETVQDVLVAFVVLDVPPPPETRGGRFLASFDPVRIVNGSPLVSLSVFTVFNVIGGYVFTEAYAQFAGGRAGIYLVMAVVIGLMSKAIEQRRRPQRAVRS
jgi:hypothetical protein